MKNLFLFLVISCLNFNVLAQNEVDKSKIITEFNSLKEALKSPSSVNKLSLNNQKINLDDVNWQAFTNLEYLNLSNDNISEIPESILSLKSLKILDLSGNNFSTLPQNFSKLENLEEVFLNKEKKLEFRTSSFYFK